MLGMYLQSQNLKTTEFIVLFMITQDRKRINLIIPGKTRPISCLIYSFEQSKMRINYSWQAKKIAKFESRTVNSVKL